MAVENAGLAEVDAAAEADREGRERLIFFSDAVIAIALTLLALDLPVPRGATDRQMWHSFLDNARHEYLFFLISFNVIGQFWRAHHRYFRQVERVDARLVGLNMWYLLLIVLLPFATRVLGEPGSLRLQSILYAIVVAALAGVVALMAIYATAKGLNRPGTSAELGRTIRAMLAVTVVFVVSIPISLIWGATAGEYFWLVLVAIRLAGRLRLRLRRTAR